MSPETLTTLRELHSRITDGLQVRLLWCQANGRLFVAVNDFTTGEAFSVEVPKGKRPLEVFTHPFAYAA
jgi:hypothetical protein